MSRRGLALFGALSVIWGVPYLLIRIAVVQLSPSVLVFGRTALAAAVLLPVALARGSLTGLAARWRWIAVFAVAEIAVPWIMLGFAEKRLTSSLTALLIAAIPMIALLLTRLAGLEGPIAAGRVVGLLVGLAGVAALAGLDVGRGDLLSVGAVGVAVLGYALGPVIVVTRLADLPGLGVSAASLALTALAYAPAAWLSRPRHPVDASTWAAVAALGIVCSALAFVLFFALVAEVGPSRTTVITYVNPVVAVVLGVLLLDEPVTRGLLIGFPLVLLGSWLATRRPAGDAVT